MFVVPPHGLFVHQPKTGGSWVRQVVIRHQGHKVSLVASAHGPSSDVPEKYLDKLIFGTTRNPWDWYLSVYQFALSNDTLTERLRIMAGGTIEFRDFLYGATHPHIARVPFPPGVLWDMGSSPEDFSTSGVGLWSFSTRRMHVDRTEVLIPTQHLREGLPFLFPSLGRAVSQTAPANTREARPHTMLPGDPRQVYNDEMLGWIVAADGDLASRLGFQAPFEPPPDPVIRCEGVW